MVTRRYLRYSKKSLGGILDELMFYFWQLQCIISLYGKMFCSQMEQHANFSKCLLQNFIADWVILVEVMLNINVKISKLIVMWLKCVIRYNTNNKILYEKFIHNFYLIVFWEIRAVSYLILSFNSCLVLGLCYSWSIDNCCSPRWRMLILLLIFAGSILFWPRIIIQGSD